MFFKSKSFSFLLSAALVFSFSAAAFADTIRLKDGTVVKGKVIGFKDQQFIVLVGDGATRASTRRSQMSLYIEDVESIEFDSETGASGNVRIAENTQPVRSNSPSGGNNADNSQSTSKPAVIVSSNLPREQKPTAPTNQSGGLSQVINSQPTAPANVPANNTSNNARPNSGKFFSLNIKVSTLR